MRLIFDETTQCVTCGLAKTMPNVLFKGSGAVKHVNWQSFAKAVDGGQTTKFFPKQNWSLYRKSLSDGRERPIMRYITNRGNFCNVPLMRQRLLVIALSKATPFNKQVPTTYFAAVYSAYFLSFHEKTRGQRFLTQFTAFFLGRCVNMYL